MNPAHSKEKTRSIERLMGWKAKQELVRSIQEKHGETPCFRTGRVDCNQFDCVWRSDCQPGEG